MGFAQPSPSALGIHGDHPAPDYPANVPPPIIRDKFTADPHAVVIGDTYYVYPTVDKPDWQTTELLSRETGRRGITVLVRPELVVEIALDGVQVSTRYPGGVALRFARVKRYRPDKNSDEADTIDELRALLPGDR